MPLNLSKALLTFSASVLLVAASATSSDARQHAKRLNTPQSEAVYDRSDSNTTRDRDNLLLYQRPGYVRLQRERRLNCRTSTAPLSSLRRGFQTDPNMALATNRSTLGL